MNEANRDLVVNAIESALYELADTQQQEGENEAFLEFGISQMGNQVTLGLDDGTFLTATVEWDAA